MVQHHIKTALFVVVPGFNQVDHTFVHLVEGTVSCHEPTQLPIPALLLLLSLRASLLKLLAGLRCATLKNLSSWPTAFTLWSLESRIPELLCEKRV